MNLSRQRTSTADVRPTSGVLAEPKLRHLLQHLVLLREVLTLLRPAPAVDLKSAYTGASSAGVGTAAAAATMLASERNASRMRESACAHRCWRARRPSAQMPITSHRFATLRKTVGTTNYACNTSYMYSHSLICLFRLCVSSFERRLARGCLTAHWIRMKRASRGLAELICCVQKTGRASMLTALTLSSPAWRKGTMENAVTWRCSSSCSKEVLSNKTRLQRF
jgi:hypothetical protein